MALSQFERNLLEAEGSPSQIMREFFGENIGSNNARKYLTGMKKLIQKKQDMDEPEPGNEFVELEIDREKMLWKSTWILDLAREPNKTPERMMELMGYDPIKWECLKTQQKAFQAHNKDDGAFTLFSVTLTMRPIQDKITSDIVKRVFESLVADPPRVRLVEREPIERGLLWTQSIMDMHFAKLAWAAETGGDYDLRIAERLYKYALEDQISEVRARRYPIKKILFPVGQDFFHSDTPRGTTTKGTQLDTDSRWPKMYKIGVDCLLWGVTQLREIAPVEIIYVPGNHDEMLSYAATLSIDHFYHNDPDVVVNISPMQRKYYRWGLTLLGFAHGAEEGKRIEKVMQVEAAEDWGQTIFREFHLGHLHSEQVKEDGGVLIRHISSLTESDAWHKKLGFIGAVRRTTSFLFDEELGRRGSIDTSVIERVST